VWAIKDWQDQGRQEWWRQEWWLARLSEGSRGLGEGGSGAGVLAVVGSEGRVALGSELGGDVLAEAR
jgi:hypothetical protein